MKRKFGTLVLFALLLLTVAALAKVDVPQAATVGNIGETKHTN